MNDYCVVTEPCHGCRFTDCVTVCPVDCFYGDAQMLYVDPTECIDCKACIVECPVDAIFTRADVPAKWRHYIPLNAERTVELKAQTGTNITEREEPLHGPGCGRP